jgi:hypothetical protein
MQAGGTFDIDDMDLPVNGMSFSGSSDMMVGQVVQIEPSSAVVNGTPPQLNTTHVRLMKNWMTAKVAIHDQRGYVHSSKSAWNDGIGGILIHDSHDLWADHI